MPHITSIGEILFDIYESTKTLGGAPFNFIYHIIKLTGEGNFISRVGNDVLGKEIFNFFKRGKISTDYLQIDFEHSTGNAIANLDEQKIPNWVIEQNCAYDFIEMNDEISNLIEKTDCIYFGTLAQRNIVSGKTIQSLFDKKIKYFCDLNIRQNFFTKEIVELSLNTSNVLKLNEEELFLLNNLFLRKKYDLIISAVQLKNLYKIDILCVTCGDGGSYLFRDEEIDYCKATVSKPVDTVGAGDAFAAILCTGYLEGWDIKRINKTANDFAGEIVMIKGALPRNDDLYNKFRSFI